MCIEIENIFLVMTQAAELKCRFVPTVPLKYYVTRANGCTGQVS